MNQQKVNRRKDCNEINFGCFPKAVIVSAKKEPISIEKSIFRLSPTLDYLDHFLNYLPMPRFLNDKDETMATILIFDRPFHWLKYRVKRGPLIPRSVDSICFFQCDIGTQFPC